MKQHVFKNEIRASILMVVLGLIILVSALLSGDYSFGVGLIYLGGGLFINSGVRKLMALWEQAHTTEEG